MIGPSRGRTGRALACASFLIGSLSGPLPAQESPRPEKNRSPVIDLPRDEPQPGTPERPALPEAADPEPDDAPVDLPPLDLPSPADTDALQPESEAPTADIPALPERIDKETLRQLVEAQPKALGPLSIGTPDGGLLFNPVPMPEGPLWSVREPRDSFGTVETMGFIATAIEAVAARLPGSPRLVIGDISRADGGRLDRHKSHQAGRDADLSFYFRTGEAWGLKPPGRGDLDLPRTWGLLRALVTETDVERVFLDRSVQRLLYDYALVQGEEREWLDNLFGRRGEDALVQHERRHLDHMHVRFFNREAQEHGRVAYPLLVQAGLLPGPTLKHRVTRGETLSHLARRYGTSATAIRSANGLRGSALRAGRTYVIPVRKVPAAGEPIVIPPRRLPPSPKAAEVAAAVAPDFPDRR